MRIPNFPHVKRWRKNLFDDLPLEAQWRAHEWLARFYERRNGVVRGYQRPILIGRARWLALHPPTSEWGRSMRAKKGGYAVQRQYVMEGRTGERHPAHRASAISASRRKFRKRKREEAEEREKQGLPPKPRHWFLPTG